MEKLKDIAEIRKGMHFRKAPDANLKGGAKYIRGENLTQDGRLDLKDVGFAEVDHKTAGYTVQTGDILFLYRSSVLRAAVVDTDVGYAIPNDSIYRIRLHGAGQIDQGLFNPAFIAWFINTPTVIAKLLSEATGATMPTVTLNSLEKLKVPIIPLEKQEAIVALHQLMHREKELNEKLADARARLLRAAIQPNHIIKEFKL